MEEYYNDKLLELSNFHRNKDIFRYHNCICGESNDELIATKDKYGLDCNFVICKNCGLIRMNPYYTEDFLKIFYSEFYSPIYRNGKYCSDELFNNTCNIRGKYIIDRINSSVNINLKGLKVFEIASGSGGILKAFQNNGSDVYGCDYDEDFILLANKNGINIVKGSYDELKKFGKCDLLILSHILEHIVEPNIFINNILELVSDSGYIYIEIPTLESIAHHFNYHLFDFQSAHVYYYTEFSFLELLKKSNLFIIDKYYEYIYGRGYGFLCKKNKSNENNYNLGYFLVSSFINNCDHFKNVYIKTSELENKIKNYDNKISQLEIHISNIIHNIVNTIAWWIPIKKWRDNFRNKILNTDQTRPDQNRQDKTRPD